jgi:hypothetical protein
MAIAVIVRISLIRVVYHLYFSQLLYIFIYIIYSDTWGYRFLGKPPFPPIEKIATMLGIEESYDTWYI